MSLEEEALKSAPPRGPRAERPPTAFDRLLRFAAALLLLGVLSVVYWIPMALVGGSAAAIVLAVLTMLGAAVASRLYHLRNRVTTLEGLLETHTAPRPIDGSREELQPLEEVEKKP